MYTDTARIFKLEKLIKNYSDELIELHQEFESHKQKIRRRAQMLVSGGLCHRIRCL